MYVKKPAVGVPNVEPIRKMLVASVFTLPVVRLKVPLTETGTAKVTPLTEPVDELFTVKDKKPAVTDAGVL